MFSVQTICTIYRCVDIKHARIPTLPRVEELATVTQGTCMALESGDSKMLQCFSVNIQFVGDLLY